MCLRRAPEKYIEGAALDRADLRRPHWYILIQFNSTLPLARYAQSHYALLVHWGYALHSTNRATCFAFSL
jgi:hypothetical protein